MLRKLNVGKHVWLIFFAVSSNLTIMEIFSRKKVNTRLFSKQWTQIFRFNVKTVLIFITWLLNVIPVLRKNIFVKMTLTSTLKQKEYVQNAYFPTVIRKLVLTLLKYAHLISNLSNNTFVLNNNQNKKIFHLHILTNCLYGRLPAQNVTKFHTKTFRTLSIHTKTVQIWNVERYVCSTKRINVVFHGNFVKSGRFIFALADCFYCPKFKGHIGDDTPQNTYL